MNIVIPVILLFLFVTFLISFNNDFEKKKRVRHTTEMSILRKREEKKAILFRYVRTSHINEYEKYKIDRGYYDSLISEEYRNYIEALSSYYETDAIFRSSIDGILARDINYSDPLGTYNLVNNYNRNNMYYTTTDGAFIERIPDGETPQFPYTDVRAQSSAGIQSTSASGQWEYDSAWTTTLRYYEYPKEEKKEDKKIDPNKEIIKHLTKICKNKKGV